MIERKPRKRIRFSLEAPGAEAVFVAGDFNDWNPGSHPLRVCRNGREKGIWQRTLHLEPGIHEYRFIVDGAWRDDPACMEGVPNAFGTCNCVLRL